MTQRMGCWPDAEINRGSKSRGFRCIILNMTQTQKRKIAVDGVEYEWCIRGGGIWTATDHITIYKPKVGGTPIYLDPYPWALEIRPRTVAGVIRFARQGGWVPEDKGKPFRVGFVNNELVVLPEGIGSSHEYEVALREGRLPGSR